MPDSKEEKYTPPRDMWEVNASLEFNEPLESNDPRYVETEPGRGKFSFHGLYSDLGIDFSGPRLHNPPERTYHLFCGHRGCGKSTELRQVSHFLHQDELYYVISIDSVAELDNNNLRYPDVLLALAQRLLESLQGNNIELPEIHLKNLKSYFIQRVLKDERLKEFSSEVNADLKSKFGIPFLVELAAKLTNKIKTSATYIEEIREVVQNSFTQFVNAFHQLINAAENALKAIGKSGKLIFIVDGTDQLQEADSHRFFITEVKQLQQIKANFIYSAPIHLLYEDNKVKQNFNHFILPMIKIAQKIAQKDPKDPEIKYEPFDEGYRVLRDLIYNRMDPQLFESETLVDELIENSGGNPRDLLRMIRYAIRSSDKKQFKREDIDEAIHNLAMEYRMILNADDYKILYEIDQSEGIYKNSKRVRELLFDLAILQYNNYWWRSHPIIRQLEEYKSVALKSG